MPIPYERAAAHETLAVPRAPMRPPYGRPVEGRVFAGVCVGLAEHLGWPVRVVRIAMVLSCFPTGAGLVAYVFLWALSPQTVAGTAASRRPLGHPRGAGVPVDPAAPPVGGDPGLREPSARAADSSDRESTRLLVGGGALLLVGVVVVAQNAGLNARLGLLAPLLVVAIGAVIAWSQLDDSQRGRWLGSENGARRFSIARLTFGAVLAVVGLIVLATRGQSLSGIWDIGAAALAVLAGAALIAAPWGLRLWSDLRHEQAERARATERADIAAHLHDSVLQTLALIQRKAEDPAAVTLLARAQERELRAWLYAGPAGSDDTLAAAVAQAAHEVEDLHGIPVEVVCTGDRPLDDGAVALVRAVREAVLNAVRHGAPPVSVYVEAGHEGVEAFVRDHGPGFDLDEVPADRLGVRQSIVGRMSRHGGQARVRRLEQGTEVQLTLPATPVPATPVPATPVPATPVPATPVPATHSEEPHDA